MRRIALLVLPAAVVAAVFASTATAALFFLFKPTAATAGDAVSVRLGGTPPVFTLDDREKPFGRAMRVYLVPRDVAEDIGSRMDERLHFVGSLVPDRNGRGLLTFRAPPLDTGSYTVAAWCPGCAQSSFGKTFFVLRVPPGGVGRFRHLQLLHVRLPSAAESCPVSREGRNGNGLLSVNVPPEGVLVARKDPDGTLFQKLGWLPHRSFPDTLTVRGERLDADGRMRVLSVNWGHVYVNGQRGRGSWASAVTFPSEGCWRITGRVQDVTISYVVKVVPGL